MVQASTYAEPYTGEDYSTFSGIDIRISIDGKSLGCVQSLSFTRHLSKPDEGTLTLLLFREDEPERFLGGTYKVVCVGATEDGTLYTIYDVKAKFDACTTTVSLDDIGPNETYHFEVIEKVIGNGR